jgi:glycosyltransferase involved in cell wall biosynthesis
MVQLMLGGFGGDRRTGQQPETAGFNPATNGGPEIACYHVNARLSNKLEDIGNLRFGKLLLLLGYCLRAIWYRFRYGVTNFYYVPAPGKRSALYRDWMVMFVCRPFFKKLILHWHAAGLATWLETVVQMRFRSLTYRLMKQVDLSIVLSRYNRADAEKLFSRQIKVVGNGIPDPCPEFADEVLPRRKARFAARRKLLSGQTLTEEDLKDTGGSPQIVRVLYLAHCTREKGLFDALAGVALASQRLAERRFPVCLRLLVAGTFVTNHEKIQFDQLAAQPGMSDLVQYYGFVSGAQKNQLLREADLFCFPTYYENENQPVNLIEAMAFGLPILTTRWRSLPELFPANYSGLVDIRSPEQVANVMPALMTGEAGDGFREIFLRNFTLERHLAGLADAFTQLEQAHPAALPAAALGTLPR